MEAQAHGRDDRLEIVWGAEGIARVIGLKRSQVYYMLRKGMIKAARKTGDRVHADVPGLRAQFCSEAHAT